MKSIVKIIFGSMIRHWIAGFLTLLVTHHWLNAQLAASLPIDSAFSDDYIFDALMACLGALLPALLAILSRLRAKLKERIALWLPKYSSEREVKRLIASAPLGARISATLTTDPQTILKAAS